LKNIILKISDFFESLTSLNAFFILLVLGGIVYVQTIWYPFVHDDFVFIVGNPDIGRFDDLKEVFLRSSRFESGFSVINLYYRPVLDVLYKVQYKIFGFYPAGYHLTNIIFHILNGFFVFWIVRFFLKEKKIALIASALFLLHPIQSESVCAVAGISNLLMTFLCLSGFILYLRRRDCSTKRNRFLLYIISVLLFCCALFTKERAVVFPLLILCYEICQCDFKSRWEDVKRVVLRCTPFFVVLLGYFKFRSIALGKSLPELGSNIQEIMLRMAAIPETLLVYSKILVFPVNLHYYRSQDILSFSALSTVGFLVVLLLMFFSVGFFLKNGKRIAFFGLGWFFISLLPVLNIVPLVNEYSIILTAEHFLYFSFLGFLLLIMIFFKEFQEKSGFRYFRAVSYCVFIVILLIFSIMTTCQSRYWKGEVPLFERTLKFEKNLGRVRILLARAYYFNHDYEKAMAEYGKALKIMQGYVSKTKGTEAEEFYLNFIKEIHFDLAHCYEGKMDFKRSVVEYQEALKFDPDDSKIYSNIGTSYFHMQDFDNAILYFNKAIRVDSGNMFARNNLALCYLQKDDLPKAIEVLEEISHIDPRFGLAQDNLKKMLEFQKENQ